MLVVRMNELNLTYYCKAKEMHAVNSVNIPTYKVKGNTYHMITLCE